MEMSVLVMNCSSESVLHNKTFDLWLKNLVRIVQLNILFHSIAQNSYWTIETKETLKIPTQKHQWSIF